MATAAIPTLRDGDVTLRPIRARDAKVLERVLIDNRGWLRQWEATYPGGRIVIDTRASIRNLLGHARTGHALPFVIESTASWSGSSTCRRSRSARSHRRRSGTGVSQRSPAVASRRPPWRWPPTTASRDALHRMEICIRPENQPSLRVVEKLGFRYEGLRRRFIHINGDWRDHFAFALVAEEVPKGVLRRWREGTGAARGRPHPRRGPRGRRVPAARRRSLNTRASRRAIRPP
jgi:ribosomal-protein-alanine N-acetyltransferase